MRRVACCCVLLMHVCAVVVAVFVLRACVCTCVFACLCVNDVAGFDACRLL